MATQKRFDLNAAMENWRQELAAQPHLSFDHRRELEDHLANSMDEFRRRGRDEKEAFRLACLRIGTPRKLNREFEKGHGFGWDLPYAMTAGLLLFLGCLWVWSHCAKHSLFYGRPNENISVVIDRGIVQFQLNRRNVEDDVRHVNSFLYNPRAGFNSGFEWDEHRRHGASGRESLKAWGPKTGMAGFLAKCGFASWSSTWGQAFSFGSSFRSREIFAPFWFLALMALLPVFAQPIARRGIRAIKLLWIRWRGEPSNRSLAVKSALINREPRLKNSRQFVPFA
ncbi:MAG TPA: hypothetical protein VG938_09015 [Verrucomicrobiae bacterium]|jgi:hypothetical protein|nr:hypothetical protein [Verrucomicrobiae bacterium]